jgi:hypothetical protein
MAGWAGVSQQVDRYQVFRCQETGTVGRLQATALEEPDASPRLSMAMWTRNPYAILRRASKNLTGNKTGLLLPTRYFASTQYGDLATKCPAILRGASKNLTGKTTVRFPVTRFLAATQNR